jgi:hypothetical protein
MTAVYQAVEKRPDSAAKDGCDDGANAQAIDSSRASPGVYQIWRLEKRPGGSFFNTLPALQRRLRRLTSAV